MLPPRSHLVTSCVFVVILKSICDESVKPSVTGNYSLTSENICSQPIMTGSCLASKRRYGFFSEKGRCEQFIYGGCGGNRNNFESIEECFNQCGGNPPTIEIGCDRRKCDWRTFGPYLSSLRECQPIYEGGQCCPTRFDCKTFSERGLDPGKCYYRGKEYQDDLNVEVKTGCFAKCSCRNFTQFNSSNSIVCPIVECPEAFVNYKPGCRKLYQLGKCCEVGRVCDEVPSESPDCEWEGKSYKLGNIMVFTGDDVCQLCICTKNFTHPRGPGCQKQICGYEDRNTEPLGENCIYVHIEDECCPYKYICPNEDKIQVLESCKSQIDDEREYCRFGEAVVSYGRTVDVIGNCKFKCRCSTPPDLSCIEYNSCEEAAVKECFDRGNKEMQCPDVNCPHGCNKAKDFRTGCVICFCSNLSYSCPEAKCPSSCENTKVEMNETSGCYECTCN